MSIPYNINEPAANVYPGDSQPRMLVNTSSISTIISVDHVGFNTPGGGQHEQVTFNGNNVPAAPVGVISVLYTNDGIANPPVPELFWKNSQATLPISLPKAYAVFQATGAPALLNSFNIASVAPSGPFGATSNYTITVSANVIFGNDPGVLITASANYTAQYTYAANVLQIFNVPANAHVTVLFLLI